MTQDAKKAALAQYLVTKGIADKDEVEAEIQQMANDCPAATAQEKGLQTDIDKAYDVMLTLQGNNQIAPTAAAAVTTQPTAVISAAESDNIRKVLVAQQADRAAVSNNSSIETLVFDRPAPKDYIPAGTKGVIEKETWDKIAEKWGGKVLADDEEMASMSNYKQLEAAAAAGTPVDVYVGSLNTKAVAYVVNKGTVTGADNKPVQMLRSDMMNFLVLDSAGYILASPTKPGVRMRYIKARNDTKKPGHVIPAKSVISDQNKKGAIEAGSYQIAKEATGEAKETALKSALAFKVDTGIPKKLGGNVIRTVRVTVKATIPSLVRKPEFVDLFANVDNHGNKDLMNVPVGDVLNNIGLAQQNSIAMLKQKSVDPNTFQEVVALADKLQAFDMAQQAGPAVTI